VRALSHVFFFSTLVRCGEYRSQTGIQRKLNFVSVRTIKERSNEAKTDGKCKDKTDGGVEFSAASATLASPQTAAAGGLSPMWSLGLAACLVSAAASTVRL
jgi:hypothetical protein